MFDFGMGELLIIGVVALIVVGPKDLPVLFRQVGRFTGKMRGMAREFTNAMNDAADEAGVKDVASDLRKMTSPKAMAMDEVSKATKGIMDWDPEIAPRTGDAERAAKAKAASEGSPATETEKLAERRAAEVASLREAAAERAAARAEATEIAEPPEAAVEATPEDRRTGTSA